MDIELSKMPKSKIISLDCTEEYERYFEIGQTTVTGGYRQTAPTDHARFGYRITLPHRGKPHLLEVRYPDDMPRMLLVSNGSSYDLSCGVFTEGKGGEGVLYNVFWPRWEEETVVFCSWHGKEPVAVCSFAVYELDRLPKAAELPRGRSFGMQYEDPCNIGAERAPSSFTAGWISFWSGSTGSGCALQAP